MTESEIGELRARSDELAGRLGDDAALEVNAAILDLDPGDPVATNRLGIGLINAGRAAEAVHVLEVGIGVHPQNPIMNRRLQEARRAVDRGAALSSATTSGTRGRGRVSAQLWTGFYPAELVERSLRGPGRDACIRFCGASIRASEAIDARWTAVTPIKQGRRFRIIGGIFTGVAPRRETLTVAVPVSRRPLIDKVLGLGGYAFEPPKAVASVQLAIPRPNLSSLFDELFDAHREHLKLSLAAGPPTHLNKHHAELRRYLLDESEAATSRA